jgi:hypothetical protein
MSSVYDAARGPLSKHGLSVVQITQITDSGAFILMTQLSHASGQWMRSWYPIRPVKDDPQGLGSATTYARRYAYCAIIGIAADDDNDDDDGNEASNLNNLRASTQQAHYPQQAQKEYHKDVYRIEPVIKDGNIDLDEFGAEIEAKIAIMTTLNDISMLNRANAKTLKLMKEERPEMFAEIGRQFQEKTQQIGG